MPKWFYQLDNDNVNKKKNYSAALIQFHKNYIRRAMAIFGILGEPTGAWKLGKCQKGHVLHIH